MTTDHWPLTTSLRWLYAAALACALGMLFKPVLIAIPVCVLIGMKFDPTIRRAFRTKHSLAALFIVLLSQLPVLIWNANHNWVTFRHILTQGGMGAQAGESKSYWYSPFARLGEYLGGQAGGMGGIMFVLLVIAILLAIKKRRIAAQHSALSTQDSALPYTFLLAFTLPLWLFYLVMNLWKRTEVNWPAASYFTGMILLAGIFTEGWNALDAKIRRPWRVWGTIAIAWGFLMTAAAMNFHRAYPYIAEKLAPKLGTEAYFKSWLHPTKWDQPTVRLRGLQDRAAIVERAREELRAETGHDPLLVTARYDTSSSLSFYLPNHPFVFSLMSSVGGRQSQYDLWPGLNEQKPDITLVHAGQNALIIGNFDDWAVTDVLQKSFQRLDPPRTVFIQFNGIQLKTVTLRNAYNFLGVPKTTGTGSF